MKKQEAKAEAIREAEAMRDRVLGLLTKRIPFSQWADKPMGILVEALDCQWGHSREQGRANELQKHLFGNTSPRVLPQGIPINPDRDLLAVNKVREKLLEALPPGLGLEILREQRRRRNNPWGMPYQESQAS